MTDIHFSQLPVLLRFSSLATLFLGWLAFAELIIDRHHLDRFLPFYRVGNICPYDLTVIFALIGIWVKHHRR